VRHILEIESLTKMVNNHEANVEFLNEGVRRINEIKQISYLSQSFLDNGFIDLISIVGYQEFFEFLDKHLEELSLINESEFLSSLLALLTSDYDLPVKLICSTSEKLNYEFQNSSFDPTFVNSEFLETYFSMFMDVSMNINVFDLVLDSYVKDIENYLFSVTSDFIKVIYREIVLFNDLYNRIRFMRLRNLQYIDLSSEKDNQMPVVNILSLYRDKYVSFLREFTVVS